MDAALDRETIDGALLCDVVSQALDRARVELGEWDCRPLAYDVKNVGALGVYRLSGVARSDGASHPWSVMLKIVRNPAGLEVAPGYVLPPDDFPPTHFAYWKREVLAYQSGVLADMPGGVAAPRCFAVVEVTPQVFWLWLEDLAAVPAPWTLARYRETAQHLGHWNGAYLAGHPLPAQPWLHYDWLASWVDQVARRRGTLPATAILPAVAWEHPLLRGAFTRPLLDRLDRLWDDAPVFLAARARLPHTLCHRDAFPANLFTRTTPDGQHQTVAIDWAFVGIGPVGEELAPLIGMRADPDPGLARGHVEEAVFDGYVTGLRAAGWHDDPRLIRLGYAATAPLRYSIATAATLALTILQDGGSGALEERRHQPIAQIVAQDAAFVMHLLDLADEARILLADR